MRDKVGYLLGKGNIVQGCGTGRVEVNSKRSVIHKDLATGLLIEKGDTERIRRRGDEHERCFVFPRKDRHSDFQRRGGGGRGGGWWGGGRGGAQFGAH